MRDSIENIINETIKKIGDKYVVYPKRGGKRLGAHANRKDAEKQLAAIEISKKENLKEATIKKKFSIKHKFIHFTTKERAKKIIKNRKLLRTPEGITNFGPSKIYAVSVDYGLYYPPVQITHLLKHSSLSEIVAIEFQTTKKPQIIFPEEAIWDHDEIPVINPKILTIAQAKKRIETKSNPLNDDYSEHIIFESEDL